MYEHALSFRMLGLIVLLHTMLSVQSAVIPAAPLLRPGMSAAATGEVYLQPCSYQQTSGMPCSWSTWMPAPAGRALEISVIRKRSSWEVQQDGSMDADTLSARLECCTRTPCEASHQ